MHHSMTISPRPSASAWRPPVTFPPWKRNRYPEISKYLLHFCLKSVTGVYASVNMYITPYKYSWWLLSHGYKPTQGIAMHPIFLCNGYYGMTTLEKLYYFIPIPVKNFFLGGMPRRTSQTDSVHFSHGQSFLRPLRDQITLYFCRQGECAGCSAPGG